MSLQGNPGANIAVCAAAAADQKRVGENSLRLSSGWPRIRYLDVGLAIWRASPEPSELAWHLSSTSAPAPVGAIFLSVVCAAAVAVPLVPLPDRLGPVAMSVTAPPKSVNVELSIGIARYPSGVAWRAVGRPSRPGSMTKLTLWPLRGSAGSFFARLVQSNPVAHF
jgi:hypothetical protein